ncbi:glyceraldehyde 3-phosphate dehydrogenase [Loktanella fryxellensis]|uniref:Glyceraldehyde 3-phosphate dehydrogenase n=1 Tax=Loktanella fryxellensis TaxID=245187 RepID=A0A1H8E9Z0_9RHOB|nr:glyceraldehyde 3-phosphate dehydrogenase NAD-binding domain-containing protein [Loktanella fryxellensis]SEN15944.1 glyceraldehyde 3-phosphate dehydrogenase [Loktanella fryxellensis]
MRVLVNGFGRIGRTILRQLLTTRTDSGITVAGINDIAPLDMCAYLFAYDSVFGPYPGVVGQADGYLMIDGATIPVSHAADLSTLDLRCIDLVLDCTGIARTADIAARGLAAGAGAVLISGPSPAAEVTVVLGANDADLGDARIVSNASCTTNALAPLLRHLDTALGVVAGHMTTIHCYTSSQPMTDAPRGDFARSRAGALSMVPTTTSAAALVTQVLPHLAGRLTASAVRVPVASVSAIDLTATVDRAVTTEGFRDLLAAADPALIGTTALPLVSSDLRGRPESLIVALPECFATTPHQIRVFGWYDNEWGFSARMIDMAVRMGHR